ncbi:fungal specific transcription factor [Aspergillus terreus]|uniref:Fungal specific transcription factor n=1 Tax=Aspergillus terreus TaxID=33178 RepID=A0A5M3YVY0_ASPTE|nr:hypothetical protein ATETN484_0003054000 [Aspergillus terreus]GFF14529.1 fungal specific transcription factor [Aspergillus terreus]
MKRVLGYLQELSFMDSLIQEYYAISEAAVIPKPLVLNSLAKVKADHGLRKGFSETEITWILENTIQQFDIQPTIEGRDFHELFTGPKLRLETVALIYSLAGIANMFCLTQDKSSPRNLLEYRSLFAKRMLLASDTILQICKILTPVNDLTIWVLYENVILSTVVYGDYSSTKWHRLGELSTHMFELGLHRDSHQSPDLPPFLVESRRRLFAAAYQLDKSIATFLGRPPRITQRHSDCRLPLDIGDEALSSNAQIALASQSLDSNGWNLHGRFQRSAWIRLRFLISMFREEILELSLQGSKEETADQLRLLVQRDPEAQAPLLDVSATLLSTVLVFGTHHQHMIDIQRDFTWVILLYGFPSAGVLIKALQKEARTGHPMPYKGSRSLLIRNLSVLISHLESISRPNIANHELFARASKVLSIILDEVLEPRDPGASSKVDFDAFPATIDGLGELEDMNLVDTMEWGGVFDQWIL